MNNIIKAFSIGLLILLITAAQACATTVSIADVTVEPDGVVTIPIMISGITDYGSGTINIEYDPSVVHVTDVTDSPDSQVPAYNANNTMGLVRISAANVYGASGDIIFANVEFTAVGTGSTPLDLDVVSLYDRSFNKISPTIIDGSISIPQPPAPCSIHGYVYYDNGTPCNNPRVNITNLNTGKEWAAGTSSNYYQITLTSGIDLNASEILRFNVMDGTNTNVTDHTITTGEVDDGGLFDFNLTLGPIPGDVNGDGYLTTADATIVLQMAVRGEYSEVADVSRDDAVTSLDALMILQAIVES
jgi:hypothetical protein